METPYEKKFGKVEPVDKKQHKRGWWRSAYYWLGWEYESKNDYPKEEDVNRKQVLMKQVTLSKLKMRKVRIDPKIPFDLQKIKSGDKKVPNILKDSIEERERSEPSLSRKTSEPVALKRQITNKTVKKPVKKKTVSFAKESKNVEEGEKEDIEYILCPPNSPSDRLSQKQKNHKLSYKERMKNLKNMC